MKILSIGNSFSVDAHAYLYDLAKQRGFEMSLVDLAIGGCSLQTHWTNVEQNNANYAYIIDGGDWTDNRVSIEGIIKSAEFDAVTVQQVSHFSGKYETYQPYLDNLVAYVRENQPNAKLYFHKTWAYELDSQHSEFYLYDKDQKKMYAALCEASSVACNAIDAIMIPAGDVIQAMRERLSEFDYANGGQSLCCDGFHMSHTYGRYAVALTWLATFTGERVEPMPFKDLDIDLIAKICEIVNEIVFGR